MKFVITKGATEYWVSFVASNGEILGHTENYKEKASAVHCANLLKSQGGGAQIVDRT